ncbi:MAG TPA: tetratricopeptide repeat protein [Candidatus Paceibacterota bacterium]|nr:tetratricopeptide repeat protein [Candidatus Paceibacterota bacterium]
MHQKFIAKFTAISFTIILIICALCPLFFLPSTWGGVGAVKGILLYGGVFLAVAFWLLAQFVGGTLKLPRHAITALLGAWVVLSLVSAFFSANRTVSLWGRGFSMDSFAAVLVLSLFTFLVASFCREQKRLVTLFLATFIGAVVTIAAQVILYALQHVHFVATYLGHVAIQGTLVGTWVDFAYFTTLTFLLSLLIYEVLMPKGFFKILSFWSMILSTVVLICLNFKTAWIIAVVSSLIVFVYKSSVERSVLRFLPPDHETPDQSLSVGASRFPLMSFITLLVGLFFFLSSASIGAHIARYLGVSFTAIRPSFSTTTHVMRATLWRDPLLGAGAGRFNNVWNLYHPLSVNQTQFWNTAFDSGFGIFQTMLTTNGVLVGVVVFALILLSLVHGFRLFNHKFPDHFSRFIAVAALIMFVVFAGLFFFSSPGPVLIVLGFMYLGLLLGVSTLVGRTSVMSINYLRDPRSSFFAILLLVVAIMASFSAVYFSGNRFASIIVYNRALTASSNDIGQRRLDRAIAISPNDIYLRTRAALFMQEFTAAASDASTDKTTLQDDFSQAEASARAAVAWDTTSADNWLSLSQVYQLVASNPSSTDAYNAAKQAADKAQALSPNNPLYVLNEAQLALIKGDVDGAKSYITQAIQLKADYLDAYVLLAQIRINQGDTTAGVDEMTQYTQVAPYDEQGYLLLAQAESGVKDYQSALTAYTRAYQLNPSDPNALLGIINTETVLGQKDQALSALDAFAKEFPNVSGIDQKRAQIEASAGTPAAPSTTSSSSPQPKSGKK